MKSYKLKMNLFRAGVALIGAFAYGAVSAQTISGTVHDLGSGGGAPATQGATAEVCVFCHTPHGADNTASVPLWNKTLDATPATTYTTYDSLGTTSQDGEILDVGSVSIACLSCHDGSQAMDSLINYPGSGSTAFATTVGTMGAASIANLGVDLSDDHPVGVQYAGGGYEQGAAAAPVDGDFKAAVEGTANGQTIWWVDTETTGNGSREKTDMALYTRVGTTSGANEPFVECASCHDPHNNANGTFLRISNDGSAVCLACHTK